MEAALNPRIALSDLVHRVVDKSYEDLYSLSRTLLNESDTERRKLIISYLSLARKRFIEVLVLMKWSAQAPLIDQCRSFLTEASNTKNQLNETNDRLFFMHADLNRAKEGLYDVNTAVDVFFGGSYLNLPTIIENAMQPRELPKPNHEETKRVLEDALRFRLLNTTIPPDFTRVYIDDGFLVCQVESEFEVVLSLQGKDSEGMWRVVSAKTFIAGDPDCMTDKADHHAKSSSHRSIQGIVPSSDHNKHFKNLLQRRLNVSKIPLQDVFNIMRDFCSSLALEVLSTQAKFISEGRWKGRLKTQYHRGDQILDFTYWHGEEHSITMMTHLDDGIVENSSIINRSQLQPRVAWPSDCMCVRISLGSPGKGLLDLQLHPLPPTRILGSQSIMGLLGQSSSLLCLSAESILLAATKIHATSGLYRFQQRLTINLPGSHANGCIVRTKLISGEPVMVLNDHGKLSIKRADIDCLQNTLDISVDLRSGKLIAMPSVVVTSSRALLVTHSLQKMLREQSNYRKSAHTATALMSIDSTLQAAIATCISEIAADELSQIGRSCIGVDPECSMPLSWDKVVEYRRLHGGNVDVHNISSGSLFFPLLSNTNSTYYLVLETNREAKAESGLSEADSKDCICSPSFSLIQVGKKFAENAASTVQYFHRFPAFRKSEVTSLSVREIERRAVKKPRLSCDARLVESLILLAARRSRHRIRLQQISNDARCVQCKIRFAGEGKCQRERGTSSQVLQLILPDFFDCRPLNIKNIFVHLASSGDLEIRVHLQEKPLCWVRGKGQEFVPLRRLNHSTGDLSFLYPATATSWSSRPLVRQPCQLLMDELRNQIAPFTKFALELHALLSHDKRCGTLPSKDGVFYVEASTPFSIVLLCVSNVCCENVEHRIVITHERKGFVLDALSFQYPLLNYLQTLLNVHRSPAQLIEALERSLVPMYILTREVESRLLSMKYSLRSSHSSSLSFATTESTFSHHSMKSDDNSSSAAAATALRGGQDAQKMDKTGGSNGSSKGKFSGKGIRLGYTSDKILVDDKAFMAAELVLIPRSQNRIKLAYSNRCGVDVTFLPNKMIRIKSAAGGIVVPSCVGEKGQEVAHAHFHEKIKAIFTEMGSL